MMLPRARHRCDISLKEAVLPGRNDVEMRTANTLHALAYKIWFPFKHNLISIYSTVASRGGASRASLALRTHFEVLGLGLEGQVLGLGLEASSPRKLLCPRLEYSTIFWTVEIFLENARNLAENLWRPFLFSSRGDRLKKIFWRTFFCGEHLRLCPWFLVLTSRGSVHGLGIFCVLGLEPFVLDSTSGCSSYVRARMNLELRWQSCLLSSLSSLC